MRLLLNGSIKSLAEFVDCLADFSYLPQVILKMFKPDR